MENISFRYDPAVPLIENLSISCLPGTLLGVIGPNGAGKSTVLKIAAGILKPHSGQILLDNRDIQTIPRRGMARQLGYLPQNVTSMFDYRVQEIVSMGRFAHAKGLGLLTGSDRDIIQQCLKDTELTELKDRPIQQLSGGQRQRVFLASILAQQPRVMLLDEPTAELDLHHQSEFFSLLLKLTRKGIAIGVVTHELNLACQFCHQLILLHQGKCLCQGAPEEVVREEILLKIYPQNLVIGKHPKNQKPVVLPTAAPEKGGQAL